MASSPQVPTYAVEHLATFSTTSPQQQKTTPRMALQRLFAMEKTSGIWTQRMAIQLKGNHLWILDGESSDVVERFPVTLIHQPTPFNDQNHIYNNILIFTVQQSNESQGELHIFQCVSHSAQQIVEDIQHWMRHYGVGHNSASEPSSSPVNVSVKDTVNVFNQIALQREKKVSSPSTPPHGRLPHHDPDSRSITTTSSIDSNHHNGAHRTNSHEQTLSNERYVSILNHCFDDIERFIIRLQHAAAALRELQLRNHKRGKGAGDGLLAIRARGPNEEEFFEILSKFKLAFNLLAKLKGCIHDPNAPELVHFLFTPLAIIIEAARSNAPSPIDPALVGVPYLNYDAIDLLSNCCTSKEFDLWQSLGPNWIQPIKPIARIPNAYQPVFTDGWAPTITEAELIGIASESEQEDDSGPMHRDEPPLRREPGVRDSSRPPQNFDDSDVDDHHLERRISPHRGQPPTPHSQPPRMSRGNSPPSPMDSIERDSPTAIPVSDLDQSEWLAELQARNAKIVRVLFPRTANNDKELTVIRGEILEILDDSRKWWKARNWRGQTAHVPHTIVSEVSGGTPNGRDRDSHLGSSSPNDWIRKERQDPSMIAQQQHIAEIHIGNSYQQNDVRYSMPMRKDPISPPYPPLPMPSPSMPPAPPLPMPPMQRYDSTVSYQSTDFNNQLRESISLRKPLNFDKIEDLDRRDRDRDSIRSQSTDFQEELALTLKRKTVKKHTDTDRDNGETPPIPTSPHNLQGNQELTLPLLVEHLYRKNFHPKVVTTLTDTQNGHKDVMKFLMNCTKQQLRDLLAPTLIKDIELQRLYSNLLILKNIHSYAPLDDELNSKLRHRRTIYETPS